MIDLKFDGIFDAIAGLFIIAVVAIVLLVGGIIWYFTYKPGKIIESKQILVPFDYKLETNGKNIDTVYLYKIK